VGFLSQLHNREFHIPIRLSDVLSFGLKGPLDLARLDALGLLGRAALDLSWNSASGGERQKALITRVLLGEHDLLILDEPMNHLDLETRSHLWKILRNQIEGCGRGIIMVCHDRDPAIGEWADALEVCLT
jgi:ABC-type cobalamin/Fe3+-siderophores transport system ATPase subunit